MRKLQIGVIGSAADLGYKKEIADIAEEVGAEIAKRGYTLFYGAEKDVDSLSTSAARGAKRFGGLTVGITYDTGKKIVEQEDTDIVIPTGLGRGGGREYVLALCCDAVIGVSGGSGTLNEFVAAYQNNIPLVGVRGTGGTTDLYVNKSFDGRRAPMYGANSPAEAVDIAARVAAEYIWRFEAQDDEIEKMKTDPNRVPAFGPRDEASDRRQLRRRFIERMTSPLAQESLDKKVDVSDRQDSDAGLLADL